MAERVRVREITDQEGQRLLRILRRSTGSVVTWRRAQMVLLSAQGMPVPAIAQVAFTSCDRVRDVLHNFNADRFDALYPRYRGGRSPTFTLPQRRRIKTLALSRPADHDLPFATWSLAKLADFLLSHDRLSGHIRPRKRRGEFLVFLRTLYPPGVRIGIVLDTFSPHLSTDDDPRISIWAAANNVEFAYTPTNASWLNRIEAQFTALPTSPSTAPTTPPPRAGQHDPPLPRLA